MMKRTIILATYLLTGLAGGLLATARKREPATAGTAAAAVGGQAGHGEAPRAAAAIPDEEEELSADEELAQLEQEMAAQRRLPRIADQAGRLKVEELAKLAVSGEAVELVGRVMDESRDSMIEEIRKRVRLDPRKPEFREGEIWYEIPADPDPQRRARWLASFQRRIYKACGDEKGKLVMESIQPATLFGGFGKNRISLRWSRQEINGAEQWVGTAIWFDAASGNTELENSIYSPSDLEVQFGDVIAWPAEE